MVQITQIRYLESMTTTSLFILHSPNSKEHYKTLEMLGGKLRCCRSKLWMPISIKDGHNYQYLKTKKAMNTRKRWTKMALTNYTGAQHFLSLKFPSFPRKSNSSTHCKMQFLNNSNTFGIIFLPILGSQVKFQNRCFQ